MKERTLSGVHQICLIALMSAVMCVIAPLSIPIGEVPVSAATLVIYLTVYLIVIWQRERRLGACSR